MAKKEEKGKEQVTLTDPKQVKLLRKLKKITKAPKFKNAVNKIISSKVSGIVEYGLLTVTAAYAALSDIMYNGNFVNQILYTAKTFVADCANTISKIFAGGFDWAKFTQNFSSAFGENFGNFVGNISTPLTQNQVSTLILSGVTALGLSYVRHRFKMKRDLRNQLKTIPDNKLQDYIKMGKGQVIKGNRLTGRKIDPSRDNIDAKAQNLSKTEIANVIAQKDQEIAAAVEAAKIEASAKADEEIDEIRSSIPQQIEAATADLRAQVETLGQAKHDVEVQLETATTENNRLSEENRGFQQNLNSMQTDLTNAQTAATKAEGNLVNLVQALANSQDKQAVSISSTDKTPALTVVPVDIVRYQRLNAIEAGLINNSAIPLPNGEYGMVIPQKDIASYLAYLASKNNNPAVQPAQNAEETNVPGKAMGMGGNE